MQEYRSLQLGGRLPERIERRIVEHASQPLRQRADHDAAETCLDRLAEHFRRHLAVLQWNGGEGGETFFLGERLAHAVVDETAPRETRVRRQFVAEAVEPAADQLMVDAVPVHPVAALAEIR